MFINVSLDFSKAFDTVRHSSLLHKLAHLDVPDHIYNWLADLYYNNSHCTLFHDQQSSLLDLPPASYRDPAAYVVTAGDRPPLSLATLYVNLPTTPI